MKIAFMTNSAGTKETGEVVLILEKKEAAQLGALLDLFAHDPCQKAKKNYRKLATTISDAMPV